MGWTPHAAMLAHSRAAVDTCRAAQSTGIPGDVQERIRCEVDHAERLPRFDLDDTTDTTD
ncbi:hypothetical protein [Marmoricola endophyticus]|nr:hypothetical protein [Marmoricola endophyticus]